MMTLTHVLGIALLAASPALADYPVWTGTYYEASITELVVVGATPSGGDLVAFDLVFTNISGLSGADPYSLDFGAPGTEEGIYGNLHQQVVGYPFDIRSPTFVATDSGTGELGDNLDTHFNVAYNHIVSTMEPSEDAQLLASVVPQSGLFGGFELYSYGSYLHGVFNAAVARPVPSVPWEAVHLVVPAEDLLPGADTPLLVNGGIAGLDIEEYFSFNVVPEPATISVMVCGAIGFLRRRRK